MAVKQTFGCDECQMIHETEEFKLGYKKSQVHEDNDWDYEPVPADPCPCTSCLCAGSHNASCDCSRCKWYREYDKMSEEDKRVFENNMEGW